ncbi:hypothetical protein Ciccas_003934 [Cichlidogyrus casuarinus]|uniref:O-phosphoseryl-tRNA(Sec) selenium transferase n=1 Tax=Cichlidogyrus casuarinus TaxID=1844966 RepID=A0ABD2QF81_9PLAT
MFNDEIWTKEDAKKLLSDTYCSRSFERLKASNDKFSIILNEGTLPLKGFSALEIKSLLHNLAFADSNNWVNNVGVGEREGRIYSSLVRERHFNFSHGIGRSGDLTAIQPKAPGSSLMNQLTNRLVLDLLRKSGCTEAVNAFISPMATGMTLTLCLQALRNHLGHRKRFIIWPRIDQKSCFKCIIAAGLVPVPVELKSSQTTDELITDLDAIEKAICDPLSYLKANFPEFNQEPGESSSECVNACGELAKKTSVDLLFVQSTDKNLMVPVGGAIISGFEAKLMRAVAETYPGRATGTATMDVFITLLELGQQGWTDLCQKREKCFVYFQERLSDLSQRYGLRLMNTAANPISMAISFESLVEKDMKRKLTLLGSHLFTQGCSGVRVVIPADEGSGRESTIAGYKFSGYGSHSNEYREPYLNVASAIGQEETEIDDFCDKFEKALRKIFKTKSHSISIE